MKFRAKILEPSFMRQFSSIIHTLAKQSKACVLRICQNKLYFIVLGEGGSSRQMKVWSVLNRNEFFNSYNMQGDTETNEIYLEFSSDMLASSLTSLKAGNSVISMKIKLTDKASPCLTLELELATQVTHTQLCVHDVPVTIIPRCEWSEFQEPPPIDYDVSVQMPNMRIVRNVVDRMKKLSNKLIVSVSDNGSFVLSVKTTTATIETHFENLTIRNRSSDNSEPVSVCVDVKKFSQFVTCESLLPKLVTCSITNGHLLHQHLENDGFTLDYFLAAIDD